MFHRAELVQFFFESLSTEDQARILVNKRLAGIEDTGSGVIVSCQDGTTYEGSIVVGADGVHSKTRSLMREQALKADPSADVDEELPFPVQYRTMWCSLPRLWEFPPGDHCITQYVITSSFFFSFFLSWMEVGYPRGSQQVKFSYQDQNQRLGHIIDGRANCFFLSFFFLPCSQCK